MKDVKVSKNPKVKKARAEVTRVRKALAKHSATTSGGERIYGEAKLRNIKKTAVAKLKKAKKKAKK